MATPIIMPRQGQSVESCIISNWAKKVGDKVAVGDTLFTYETDKATFDEEAKVEGTMLVHFFEEGDDVPCLLNVCVIGNEGEDVSAFSPNGAAPAPAAEAAPVAEAPAAPADGKTVVEISKLMRPGTALSGSVKFASGSTADWYIDQTGRLGLENLVGNQPTQEDIQQFQVELEKAVYGGR